MLGSTIFDFLIRIVGIFFLALLLAIAFYEARKAYWDFRIERMCQKDGGLTVFEEIRLSADDYERLRSRSGTIPLPERGSADRAAEFFSHTQEEVIRERSPRVAREEVTIYALDGNRMIARYISYSRSGGDFPTYAHPSYFLCKREDQSISERIFIKESK